MGRATIMEGRAGSGRAAHGKGESSLLLCDRPCGRTRVTSVRQLPTDHDYAARPANIRLINRRKSYLDRYLLYLRKQTTHEPNTSTNSPGCHEK
jgi:hypothetical protein